MRATDGTLRFASFVRDRQQLALQVVAVTVVFALAVGLFLIERRVSGAFSTPLPAPQLIATGALAAAWAVVVRKMSHASLVHSVLALLAILLIALACSYPGDRVVDWLIWPVAMFAVALPSIHRPLAATEPRPVVRGVRPADHSVVLDTVDAEADTEQVLQQITRVRNIDGTDAIRASLIGEFETGERQTSVYIAFCPPFERLPQVEVNILDELEATAKLTQVLHNGAQIEVRLAEPAEEVLRVGIELFATDASPS